VDVCVVGAGIAGMTTGYLLACEGRDVAIVDDGPVGGGMSGRTTAHLFNALDDRFYEIEKMLGKDAARLAAQSHTQAIDRIDEIVREENIQCDFERVDGYLFPPPAASAQTIDEEYDAPLRAGLLEVQKFPRPPIIQHANGPALRFPRQAQFHPLKYLNGLASAIALRGGAVFSRDRGCLFKRGESVFL